VLDLPVPAYIPADYLQQTRSRLEVYARLAELQNPNQWQKLKAELLDRFGAPPEPVANLLTLAQLRLLAQAQGLTRLRYSQQFGEGQVEADQQVFRPAPRGNGLAAWLLEKLKA
jgi:transcription-repair coupling factor (superfamily II helicase)